MATEIAKAYVQVVPTTKGISGALTSEMNKAGSTAGNAAGESSGNSFVGKFVKLAVAGIAAAGIEKTITAAVSQGANYEQAVGGIETLFKESSDTMINYARDAYKTCGLSANEYMQQSTSFAAALVSSCGGNTAKAVEAANTALQDMSDNANKMGTDIESIQNAYQGFAKQNYTMLDNLKLGYGGTKSEMERLLADAEAIKAKQGEVADYSIDSYADVVEAIHVVQNEMGIMGTTAKEAGTTISGSMGMVKAAWANVLTAMASGQDLEQYIQGFITSVLGDGTEANQGFANLILDMASRVIAAIPTLMQSIVQSFSGLLPQIIEVGSKAMISLVEGLAAALPTMIPEIVNIVVHIVQTLLANLPLLVDAGLQFITGLAQGILTAVPSLLAVLPGIITSVIQTLIDSIPLIIQCGIDLLVSLVAALPDIIDSIVTALPAIITNIINALLDNIPLIIQAGIDLFMSLITDLPTIIIELVKAIPQIITSLVNELAKGESKFAEIGGNLIKGLWEGIKNFESWLWDKISGFLGGIWDGIKDFFGIHSPSEEMAWIGQMMVKGLAGSIEDNGDEAVKAAKGMAKGIDAVMRDMTGNIQTELSSDFVLAGSVKSAMLSPLYEEGAEIGANPTPRMIAGAFSGGFTQNLTINAPQELSAREVARQTRLANRQMVLALGGV